MKYQRLQDLREINFWTQKFVAAQLNISQRAYSHYENGTRSIPVELLIKLADLYNVSIDFLLERTDVKQSYPIQKSKRTRLVLDKNGHQQH